MAIPLPWPGGEFSSIRDGVGGTGRGLGAYRGIGHAAGRTAGGNGHVDPLAFDLDGDGIETTRLTDAASILFDHDADGVRTGTGWLKPDDGWLVLDRDRNGTIDSGRELFGADTVKSNGRLAANGLDALADFDLNKDGKIDAADQVFASLRIWRDLNQDGISQANELTTLHTNSIASISTAISKASKKIGNGNIQTATSSFTRPDGSSGTTANLNLLDNTFYRGFKDPIALTDQARELPTLRGSGRVRDLDEAISLSRDLGDWVKAYMMQTGRQEQIGMLDQLLEKWAGTSDFKPLKAQADALSDKGVKLTYTLAGMTEGSPAHDEFIRKLGIVERFMGFTYGKRGLPKFEPLNARSGNYPVVMSAIQIATVNLTYERFKADIYESLVVETRLQSYARLLLEDSQDISKFTPLENAFRQAIAANPQEGITDLIEFISAVGETRLARVGWKSMDFLAEQLNGAKDLSTFAEELSSWTVRLGGPDDHKLNGTQRADLIAATDGADTIKAGDGDDIVIARAGADLIEGGKGNDYLDGGDGDDTITGGDGNDCILGGRGADRIDGGAGDDTIDGDDGDDTITDTLGANTIRGGQGNDVIRGRGIMEGGAGDDMLFSDSMSGDTYLFDLGDGKDTVDDFGANPSLTKGDSKFDDTLKFGAGIDASRVTLARSGNDMIFQVGATDQVTVKDWYTDNRHYIEQVQFADGTAWDLERIMKMPTSSRLPAAGFTGDRKAISADIPPMVAAQADALISAMAAFAPPGAGTCSFARDDQSSSAPMIAVNCH